MDIHTEYKLLRNKVFFLATMKIEFIPKTIIEEVKMCTEKITLITTYDVIKLR